jgi:hypothetical protein
VSAVERNLKWLDLNRFSISLLRNFSRNPRINAGFFRELHARLRIARET